MKTTSFATAVALLSTSYAATVTLETTKCIDTSIPLQRLEIEMNLSGPVARDLQQVCGLRIVSASEGVDINTIKCQAFRDVVGTQPGSAIFTYAKPALIATNPIQEKAIRCTYPEPRDVKVRRQDNGTASVTVTLRPIPAPRRSTLFVTSTLTPSFNGSSSSVAPSTITSTSIASSGIPSSSANATTTPTLSATLTPPSASHTGGPPKGNGAGAIGAGMGVAVAALFAMVL